MVLGIERFRQINRGLTPKLGAGGDGGGGDGRKTGGITDAYVSIEQHDPVLGEVVLNIAMSCVLASRHIHRPFRNAVIH